MKTIIRLNNPKYMGTDTEVMYISQMSSNPNSCVMGTKYREDAKIFSHKQITLEKMIQRIKMHDPEIIVIEQ